MGFILCTLGFPVSHGWDASHPNLIRNIPESRSNNRIRKIFVNVKTLAGCS